MYDTTKELADIQKSEDRRGVAINQVGVKGLRYPLTVQDRYDGEQHTVATVAMTVGLPSDVKGTHMSRFIEVLEDYGDAISTQTLPALVNTVRERLEAPSARVEISFPYFRKKEAPVTGKTARMDYECTLMAEAENGHMDVSMAVSVPVASLCPCSREISDYGAHNQRGLVEIVVRTTEKEDGTPESIWFEELIDICEGAASAPLYPLLKRPDERHVTMQAYDNPAFVEDIVRNVAVGLQEEERVASFEATVTNFESIHNHNAYAEVRWQRGE